MFQFECLILDLIHFLFFYNFFLSSSCSFDVTICLSPETNYVNCGWNVCVWCLWWIKPFFSLPSELNFFPYRETWMTHSKWINRPNISIWINLIIVMLGEEENSFRLSVGYIILLRLFRFFFFTCQPLKLQTKHSIHYQCILFVNVYFKHHPAVAHTHTHTHITLHNDYS